MQYARILTKKADTISPNPEMVKSLKTISKDERLGSIADKIREQLAMKQTLTTSEQSSVKGIQEAKQREIKQLQADLKTTKEKFSEQKSFRRKLALGLGTLGVTATAITLAVFFPLGIALGAVVLFGGFYTNSKLSDVREDAKEELKMKANNIEYETRIFEYSKTESFQKFYRDNGSKYDTKNPKFLEFAYLSSVERTEAAETHLKKLESEISLKT